MNFAASRTVRTCVFLAVGLVVGLAPAGASARGLDWTVNGKLLKPGKSHAITFEATTPTSIRVPGAGITFVCQTWTGKGEVTGGTVGTGFVGNEELGTCAIEQNTKCKVDGRFWNWVKKHLGLDGIKPPEATATWEFGTAHGVEPKEFSQVLTVTECADAGEYTLEGLADSNGPFEEVLVFPETPLPLSDFTVNGQPAVFETTARLKLTGRGGALGVAEAPESKQEKQERKEREKKEKAECKKAGGKWKDHECMTVGKMPPMVTQVSAR